MPRGSDFVAPIVAPKVTQNTISAADFTEPSWVKNARQTIGTDVEPVYPMRTVHGGNQEPDTSKAPIGYRYDNGKSQYQYLDLGGNPTDLVNRGNLGEFIKTAAPIALSMIGANFLAPALGDLFGPAASDLFGGGGDFGMGAGAGGVGTSINEMIASGLAPGSVGAAGAAAGALTPEALAAAAGTGLTALAPAALTPAATSLNEMVASGMGPGSAGAYGPLLVL